MSKKQLSHPFGRVVSVRLEESMLERLDTLVERVGRARRFSLHMAIGAMFPALEDTQWHQVNARFEDDAMDRQFWESMARILEGKVADQGPENK